MSFKDQMAKDMAVTVLNTNEFAEVITYTPYGGTAKQIAAQVERRRISPASEDSGRTLIGQVEIYIANNESRGVTAVNKGRDTVIFPETLGGPDIEFVVVDILEQDQGMWHLLLRK
jgi:hypothetical protein